MKVRFITPPKELQKGGIENAVEGLREALTAAGVQVADGPDFEDPETLHHFHGLWNPTHARIASALRKAGLPYVVSPHGMLEPWAFRNRWWKKWPYFWLVERRFLLGAKGLFVTSAMERDHLRRVIKHPQVEVLPLGCRDVRGPDREGARRELGWDGPERVMVFLSRVDPKKGLHLLFDAWVDSGLPPSDWRLVIVGDGPSDYLAKLHHQAATLGSRLPAIDWVGPVWGARRWPYLQAADLFCLPTHSENFGIAVLEALHAGTPVITTTGTPWSDHAGIDGLFICDPATTSIRNAIERASVRLDSGWQDSDSKSLALWVKSRFSWAHLVKEYEDAYSRA